MGAAKKPLLSKKVTPNHILIYSKQLSACQAAQSDESPSIQSAPHMERLNSHNNSQLMGEPARADPKSPLAVSPSKKQLKPSAQNNSTASYKSQK